MKDEEILRQIFKDITGKKYKDLEDKVYKLLEKGGVIEVPEKVYKPFMIFVGSYMNKIKGDSLNIYRSDFTIKRV